MGYACNISVHLGRGRKCVTAAVTSTHGAVSGLTTRIENLGHKCYMDSFFSSLDLLDDLHMKDINCCGVVRLNQKRMPRGFGRKLRLKQGDIITRVRGDFTAIVWKDKQNEKC
jgi:hypothetical protein